MNLCDYTSDELVQELKDRGYAALPHEEYDELTEDCDNGLALWNLVLALVCAVNVKNFALQTKLIEAMIFITTGEDQKVSVNITIDKNAA